LYVWHTVDIRRGPWTSRRDRKNGVGGYWATQILPFADAASFTGYMDFETAIYQTIAFTKAA
jgi:methyl acetate hydrolase